MSTDPHLYRYKRPSQWWKNSWREALLLGNGHTGVAVYGGIGEETLQVCQAGLWCGQVRNNLPDVSDHLPAMRMLMDQKEYAKASWVLADALKEEGYDAALGFPLPLCDVRIRMKVERLFRHYRRELHTDTAEATVQWEDAGRCICRRSFMSRQDDVLVTQIKASQGDVQADITLSIHDEDALRRLHSHQPYGQMLLENSCTFIDGDMVFYSNKNDDGRYFGAALRIVSDGSICPAPDDFLHAQGNEILLLCGFFANSDNLQASLDELSHRLHALPADYSALLTRHEALHRPLMNAVDISLGDETTSDISALLDQAYEDTSPNGLIEKLWRFGRYLFICGTSPQGDPFPLYGLWCGDYNPAWPHNMANENLQMIYWHAAVGGLADFSRAIIRYYGKMLPDFRQNAKNLYGCRGILMPAGTTPGIGLPNQLVPVILNWTGAAGWVSRHYYEYYSYTRDEEMLRNHIAPFFHEIYLFYKDFLTTAQDGTVKIYPSVSPENTPANYFIPHIPHPMPTTINATMDVAILRDVLLRFSHIITATGLYAQELSAVQELLTRLPSYRCNPDGSICEWICEDFDDRHEHRHISHIYPLFPAGEISPWRSPQMLQACRKAVDRRIRIGLSSQTGWSFAHLSAIYARLQDGDEALSCLDQIAKACLTATLLSTHNDWRSMGTSFSTMPSAPVQLDCLMGVVNAVQEMIFYAGENEIALLPALPKRWDKGNARNLHFPGGLCSMTWTKNTLKAMLIWDRTGEYTIHWPEKYAGTIHLGEKSVSAEKGCITLSVQPGDQLELMLLSQAD